MKKKKIYLSPEFSIKEFLQEDIITLSSEPTTGGIELPDDIWLFV